jgi:hypothetical protein
MICSQVDLLVDIPMDLLMDMVKALIFYLPLR